MLFQKEHWVWGREWQQLITKGHVYGCALKTGKAFWVKVIVQ
jgi:hypothetical protein